MSLNRYAKQRDVNEPGIVQGLRDRGVTVTLISEPGFPDIVAGFRKVNYLFEVKDGRKKSFTDPQRVWHSGWRGSAYVIVTLDDALEVIFGATESSIQGSI
jgi:hypothetical protein